MLMFNSYLCLPKKKKKKKLIFIMDGNVKSKLDHGCFTLSHVWQRHYLILYLPFYVRPHHILFFSHFVVFRECLFRQVLLTSQAKEKSILVKSLITTMINIYIYIYIFSSLIFSYSEPIKSICLFS